MVVLLDTNILIDYLTNRDVPSVEASKKIIKNVASSVVKAITPEDFINRLSN